MPQPPNDKPAGATFVGYTALTRNFDKIKRRRVFDKLKAAAGCDQLIYGASLLRSPESESESVVYHRYGVIRSSGGEYFTTVTPLPEELQPYFVGKKQTREELAAIQKKTEAARRFIENL